MKYSKRYIAFTGVLAVALLIKFNNFGEQYQTVNRFRGAQLEEGDLESSDRSER